MGTVNLLVFAMLTMVADLKGSRSVIFAMEEPEIAFPPHTQRRVTRFVRTASNEDATALNLRARLDRRRRRGSRRHGVGAA